jgi:type IV pilus assembly protein PilB
MVRKICKRCKEPVKVDDEILISLGVPESDLKTFKAYHSKGCSECNNIGFSGRTGLFEVMPITPEIERMIIANVSTPEITAQAVKEGMMTLRMAGVEKIRKGITSVDEVLAETS